jgi:hypothetical protein
VLAA